MKVGGIPESIATVAPDFIVGHSLTLLRQPYEMKAACVGDILAKTSSLWDYNYSCRVLSKYHYDFAADLTVSAYERLLDLPAWIGITFTTQRPSINCFVQFNCVVFRCSFLDRQRRALVPNT